MFLAHRIQLDPTEAQAAFFRRCCGTARYTWNWALAQCQEAYKATGKTLKLAELKKQWNATKPAWVKDCPRDCNSQPFADLQAAYSNFFKTRKAGRRGGSPRFKKKGEHDSFYLANDKGRVDFAGLYVPLLGYVRLTEILRFQGRVMSYRVTRTADRWFVSVAVDIGDYHRERTANGVVGVDLGLKSLVVTSEGEVIDNIRPLSKALKKLARAQRVMARRVKGSSRRAKARMQVARVHARVANIRKDHLHKLTTRLCRENQTVVVEDLSVVGMKKLRSLARSVSDAGFGELRRQLTYKAPIWGTRLVVADRWFPSSKMCSACGHVVDVLPLSVRDWICPECGASHDRDLNAAINLRTLGLRETTGEGQATLVDRPTAATRKSRTASRLVEARSTTALTSEHTV